jgi:lipoprotein-releasing system ATP-binding protein
LELFDKIVQTLGIQAILHKLPSQISGGEQQRVAVARALINRPTLLLADEPTGNLDNKNAENLYDLFVELKAVWQQRIIMVTHNEKLTSHSDQVIYLNSGRIE